MKTPKINKKIIFLIILTIIVFSGSYVFAKYTSSFDTFLTLLVSKPKYTVVYNQLLPSDYQVAQ